MITRKQFVVGSAALAASAAGVVGRRSAHAAEPEAHVTFAPLSPERIAAIAALLPENPRGFGPTCHDRAEWEMLRSRPAFANVVNNATRLLDVPTPAWDEDKYLDYSRTGQRGPGEQMESRRHQFLAPLVFAECLENKGRFVPRIETALHEYTVEPTWTLPAHDVHLEALHGTGYFVELVSALTAAELGQALYLIGDIIQPSVRAEVMATLDKRIFTPMRETYRTGKGHWWLTSTNNWNAVCLAGVTAGALFALPTREDRAFFAAGAERYSRNSVDGFHDDGYCIEGLGYYNYGFGNYLILRETLWQATSGKVDLFADPKIRRMATYGPRLEIENGVWPSIGDSHIGLRVDDAVMSYCNRVLGLGLTAYEKRDDATPVNLLVGCMRSFPNSATEAAAHESGGAAKAPVGLRSYFDDSGILVVRPAAASACRLGAALKGGQNGGSHCHNDLGSFTLVLGEELLVGDPGGPDQYTSKTFGPERYTAFKLFASYGHPVPLVAGKQQGSTGAAAAKITRTDFTDAVDTFAMDLTAAYPSGALTSLTRTFRYDRTGAGQLSIEDAFVQPSDAATTPFEVALTTRAAWKQTEPNTFSFTRGGETVIATVVVPDAAGGFTVTPETIEENCHPFTRLGIRLKSPLVAGKVTVTFKPDAKAAV